MFEPTATGYNSRDTCPSCGSIETPRKTKTSMRAPRSPR